LSVTALAFAIAPLLMTFPLMGYGIPFVDALFELISATGTVGLSSGISTPALEPAFKVVLALDMLLGRVEIIALRSRRS
jgi:trk system potassium uptake protein TrkH